MIYGDGAFKDLEPRSGSWPITVVAPAYTSGHNPCTSNEVKLKYLADSELSGRSPQRVNRGGNKKTD